MYYYNVVVYDYDTHREEYFTHEEEYSHQEFVLIIQECIDTLIKNYSEIDDYEKDYPCMVDSYEIIDSPKFYVELHKRGFKRLQRTTSCVLEDKKLFDGTHEDVFIKGRYDDLILGKCKDCFREKDEKCPVSNKRR